MAFFQNYLMVDWSASNVPRRGKDSIWISHFRRNERSEIEQSICNPSTRIAAIEQVAELIQRAVALKERILVGFDFPFGYPMDAIAKIAGGPGYRGLWNKLSKMLTDNETNSSNRFEVAGQLNEEVFSGAPMFWGHPPARQYTGLTPTKPKHRGRDALEFRVTEREAKGAKSVWQLSGAGCVGSQALMGIKQLSDLINRDGIGENTSVWPMDKGFNLDRTKLCTLVEIYPSLPMFHGRYADIEPKDKQQVMSVCQVFLDLDSEGLLERKFGEPQGLLPAESLKAIGGEGWILGLEIARHSVPRQVMASPATYLKTPGAIYAKSFAIIRREADFARFSNAEAHVAERIVHSCGMTDAADDLVFSPGAAEAGRAALLSGAPVISDAEMVRHGVIQKLLPKGNEVLCMLSDAPVAGLAAELETTRSAAQVLLWKDRLAGAVVAIGNAPTALFRLLELLDAGAPRPALVLGFPVGFVGAEESKAELIANSRGVPFIAIKGRRGGSAMAAAAVNALAAGWDA